MNLFNKLGLFLFLFLDGFNAFSTTHTAGMWKNYWETSKDVRDIILEEYKIISAAKKYIEKQKYLASRNTLAVLLNNSKALILISGLIPFYDYDRKSTCNDNYYDFSKIFLGEIESIRLKSILYSRMFFVQNLEEIISQISEPNNKELLSLISDYNFSASSRDLLKSLIAQNIKLSQLKKTHKCKRLYF